MASVKFPEPTLWSLPLIEEQAVGQGVSGSDIPVVSIVRLVFVSPAPAKPQSQRISEFLVWETDRQS
jgi:hypothetical protein